MKISGVNKKLMVFEIANRKRGLAKFAVYAGKPLKIIIGNDPAKAHVVVKDPYVSKQHLAVIKDEADRIYVRDLHSRNGVFVNGKKLKPGQKVVVKPGDKVDLIPGGHISMHIRPASSREESTTVLLDGDLKEKYCIGRNPDCDFHIPDDYVSSKHAFLFPKGNGRYLLIDNKSLNGTYVNGKLISKPVLINDGDLIGIGQHLFTAQDIVKKSVSGVVKRPKGRNISELLNQKPSVLIGRSKDADFIINDFSVSRRHAKITRENGRFFIEDLGSKNGTFVNGKRIKGKVLLRSNDEIRIAFEVFRIDGYSKNLSAYSAVRALGVSMKFKQKGKENHVLKPLEFSIPSKAFVALMGPSGCGKTTLMNILSGHLQPTEGRVFVHGLELSQHLDLIKQKVGYVPQDDIVHGELSVNDALFYAAKLRMNPDMSDEEIRMRIDVVCNQLKIPASKRNRLIKNLSGGERKRVSIAVELLNKPAVLFLDEPTSPLDPETIDSFLKAIKELTVTNETTVIMVTHKPSDLAYVDRVIFLGAGGYLTYYGNAEDLKTYFNAGNVTGIYATLSNEASAGLWYQKWLKNRSEDRIINQPLREYKQRRPSYLKQFYWLAKRYAHIKLNDRQNLLLLLLQPLIIPLALVFIYRKLEIGLLFLMIITAIWFGVSNAAKEIVDEIPIYKRERMFNLAIGPYLLSKVSILSLIALLQSAIFVSIIYVGYKDDVLTLNHPLQMFWVMVLLIISASLLGLMLSSSFKTSESVMSVLPIVLIPQIIFAGVITKVDTPSKELVSYLTHGRWGTELLARIQRDDPFNLSYKFRLKDTLVIKNANPDEKNGVPALLWTRKSLKKILNEGDYNPKAIHHRPEYKTIFQSVPDVKKLKDTLLLVGNGKDDQETVRLYDGRRYFKAKPIVYLDGEKYERKDPLKLLGYYENEELLNWFDSKGKNLAAIFMLNAVFLLITVVRMKKKDNE